MLRHGVFLNILLCGFSLNLYACMYVDDQAIEIIVFLDSLGRVLGSYLL